MLGVAKKRQDDVEKLDVALIPEWDHSASGLIVKKRAPVESDSCEGGNKSIHLEIVLKNRTRKIPVFDNEIGPVAGHTLHYFIGGGNSPGLFAQKRVSQMLCGIRVDDNGADVFLGIKEFNFL